jgi:hypothetical protein
MTTLTLSGTAEVTLALDTTVFSVSNGTLTIQQTDFSSLSTGSLTTATDFLVVNSGTPGTTTMSALASELSTLVSPPVPTITFSTIPTQYTGTPFSVSGTLTNYKSAPTFTYSEINPNSFSALPSGATVTSTSFAFTNPAIATAGSYYVTLKDTTNKVLGISNTFTVSALTLPKVGTTAASLQLDSSVANTVFSNVGGTTEQTTNGGVVEAWKDTVSGYLFTQSTSAYAPTLVTASQNGRNGIQTAADTGSNGQYLANSTATTFINSVNAAISSGGAGLTMALVFKQAVAETSGSVLAYIGNPTGYFIAIAQDQSGNVDISYNNAAAGFVAGVTPGALTKVVITLAPSTGVSTIYLGTEMSSGTFSAPTVAYTIAGIGNYYQTNGLPATDFYEWDVWLAAATGSEVTQIQTYLTDKWGS